MKSLYTTLTIITILILGSCTNLDVLPRDAEVEGEVFKTPEAFRSYLAKLYGAYSLTGQEGPHGDGDISIIGDEGFTSYIRAYWKAQELTTDEAVIAWTDAGIRDLHLHRWSSENQFVRVLYYRIFLIVAYCNDFLGQSVPSKLDGYGFSQEWKDEINVYRAEARFLRAMAYWHALDLFRNIPLLTTLTSQLPAQTTPEEIFNFIESELIDIESIMIDAKANEYGRADKAALWMLQAKLYLNAEVYTNQAKYTECITACNKVIASGYTLNDAYNTLFMADNDNSNEIIFALNADGLSTRSWGSTTFLVHATIGGTMSDGRLDGTENDTTATGEPDFVELSQEELENYGVTAGWEGIRATRSMVEKFGLDPENPDDPRAIFYTYSQNIDISEIGEFSDGIAVPKFTNLTSTGGRGSDVTHVDTDYPLFRLADTYLMYAEAVLRGGSGGDPATALGYVNELRERAFGDASGNITAGDLTLDFLLDERVRELYYEGTRRVDLIRYGKFTDSGIWPWKGGVQEGTLTESYRDIFPIPASELIANPLLKQNDGY